MLTESNEARFQKILGIALNMQEKATSFNNESRQAVGNASKAASLADLGSGDHAEAGYVELELYEMIPEIARTRKNIQDQLNSFDRYFAEFKRSVRSSHSDITDRHESRADRRLKKAFGQDSQLASAHFRSLRVNGGRLDAARLSQATPTEWSWKDIDILGRYFLGGETQREIAEAENITQSAISHLITRSVPAIKWEVELERIARRALPHNARVSSAPKWQVIGVDFGSNETLSWHLLAMETGIDVDRVRLGLLTRSEADRITAAVDIVKNKTPIDYGFNPLDTKGDGNYFGDCADEWVTSDQTDIAIGLRLTRTSSDLLVGEDRVDIRRRVPKFGDFLYTLDIEDPRPSSDEVEDFLWHPDAEAVEIEDALGNKRRISLYYFQVISWRNGISTIHSRLRGHDTLKAFRLGFKRPLANAADVVIEHLQWAHSTQPISSEGNK